MTRIGDKTLVFNETFMLLDNEEALLEILFPFTGPLKMSIRFLPEGGQGTLAWKMEDGIMKIVFHGWRSPIGSCTLKPVAFGNIGGEKIAFDVVHHLIAGKMNLLTLQVYQGGTYE